MQKRIKITYNFLQDFVIAQNYMHPTFKFGSSSIFRGRKVVMEVHWPLYQSQTQSPVWIAPFPSSMIIQAFDTPNETLGAE